MRYEQLAEQRWRDGREERGLDISAPFQGHSPEEFLEEMLDGINYLKQMFFDGYIDDGVLQEAHQQLVGLCLMADTARASNRIGKARR